MNEIKKLTREQILNVDEIGKLTQEQILKWHTEHRGINLESELCQLCFMHGMTPSQLLYEFRKDQAEAMRLDSEEKEKMSQEQLQSLRNFQEGCRKKFAYSGYMFEVSCLDKKCDVITNSDGVFNCPFCKKEYDVWNIYVEAIGLNEKSKVKELFVSSLTISDISNFKTIINCIHDGVDCRFRILAKVKD